MSTFIPPQLTSVLGDDLDAVGQTALDKLVGVAENDVLEYKSAHYGTSDGQRHELARDAAAFANAGGGMLIVGMGEDDDTGEATGVIPLKAQPYGTEEDTRYRQILASLVSPVAQVYTSRVDLDGGSVLLVSVPPSSDRPHAVVKDGALRYPIRDGRGRRWLGESEIADAYRSRFNSAADAVARVAALRNGLVDAVRDLIASTDQADESSAWLVLAISPDRPGVCASTTTPSRPHAVGPQGSAPCRSTSSSARSTRAPHFAAFS